MSRLVDWGHWLVSVLFAVIGADMIWYALSSIPRQPQDSPYDVTYRFVSSALGCALFAVCAWGIFKWRIWGHALALALCILAVMLDAFLMIGYRNFDLNAIQLVGVVLPILIAVWLLLPPVRAAYRRRERLA
jgi:putative Mn2+ efflux pump MntP